MTDLNLLGQITTQEASTVAALAGVGGVLITKLFDYLIARYSANPPDNGTFRDYLENQVKALAKRVDELQTHVLDCEKDRADLRRHVMELERDLEIARARGR